LIRNFNSFLPPGYLIDVSEDHLGQKTIRVSGESTQSESYEYIKYLNKVENRFHHNPEIYMQFLDILNAFHRNESYSQVRRVHSTFDMQDELTIFKFQVYNQVSMLFKDAPDLLAEFKI